MAAKKKEETVAVAKAPSALGSLTAKLAALKGAATPTSSKKGPPDITVTVKVTKMVTKDGKEEAVMVDAVPEMLQQIKVKKDAEARIAEISSEVVEQAEPERIRVSRAMGVLNASCRINHRMTYVVPHGYLMIKMDDQAKVNGLQTIFGDRFDEFFKPSNEVKIKAECLSDEMLTALGEVCTKMGKNFEELFEVKQVLVPQETLTNARVMKPDVEALFKQARSEGFIEPKKPTLRE